MPSPFAEAPWFFDEVIFSELADDFPKEKVAKSVSDVIKEVLDAATHEEVLDMLYEKREPMAAAAPAASHDFVWSWSNVGVEQAHAAATMVMKKHQEAGEGSLQTWSSVMQLTPVIQQTGVERKLEQARSKWARLARARPQYITGWQSGRLRLRPQVCAGVPGAHHVHRCCEGRRCGLDAARPPESRPCASAGLRTGSAGRPCASEGQRMGSPWCTTRQVQFSVEFFLL